MNTESNYQVVISETLSQEAADWLAEQSSVGQVIWCSHDDPGFDQAIAQADALVIRTYTQIDQALLDRAPKLKVIGRAGVGLDNVDLEACRARDVEVVYTPDANTQAVVEYVLAIMIDAVRPKREILASTSVEEFHDWRKTLVGKQLDTMTLGILGHGRIGKRLGLVAHTLGMNVLACDLLPEVELRKQSEYPFEYVDHATLYERSDILTVHTDGRASNRHLIDAKALGQMRDDVLLINAARGMLIDEAALAGWASAHPLSQVVLDVHDPEPPAKNDPLSRLTNVHRYPHLASRTHTAMANMSWVVRDVWAHLSSQPVRWSALR